MQQGPCRSSRNSIEILKVIDGYASQAALRELSEGLTDYGDSVLADPDQSFVDSSPSNQARDPTPLKRPRRWIPLTTIAVGVALLLFPLSHFSFFAAKPELLNATGAQLSSSFALDMVWIPPGKFRMGSHLTSEELAQISATNHPPEYFDKDLPQHEVTISKGFYLSKTEVTQKEWISVMNTQPWIGKTKTKKLIGDNYPASYVTWFDAVEFCEQLSRIEGRRYRLPTEAEWEYACRGGTTDRFSFGEQKIIREYAWWSENSRQGEVAYPSPVGLLKPNPFGLYDMHGNVHEWCSDWFRDDYYKSSPSIDPKGPETVRKEL